MHLDLSVWEKNDVFWERKGPSPLLHTLPLFSTYVGLPPPLTEILNTPLNSLTLAENAVSASWILSIRRNEFAAPTALEPLFHGILGASLNLLLGY